MESRSRGNSDDPTMDREANGAGQTEKGKEQMEEYAIEGKERRG